MAIFGRTMQLLVNVDLNTTGKIIHCSFLHNEIIECKKETGRTRSCSRLLMPGVLTLVLGGFQQRDADLPTIFKFELEYFLARMQRNSKNQQVGPLAYNHY